MNQSQLWIILLVFVILGVLILAGVIIYDLIIGIINGGDKKINRLQ